MAPINFKTQKPNGTKTHSLKKKPFNQPSHCHVCGFLVYGQGGFRCPRCNSKSSKNKEC